LIALRKMVEKKMMLVFIVVDVVLIGMS
jgi:hypothetical protein